MCIVNNENEKKLDVIESKDEILSNIFDIVKGKDVLDVGCVEHTLENKNNARTWVHDFLRKWSKSVKGIDIMKNDIQVLKKQGYDVYCKNAEKFNFRNLKFDVIFAGELIEHLSNPGLFLDCCRKHLKKKGRLILTTPNTFSIYRFLCILKEYTNDPSVNNQHTAWFSPKVLKELLFRYDFSVEKMLFVNYPLLKTFIKPKHTITNILSKIAGKKFRDTIIVVAKIDARQHAEEK
jgi:2-polyprenyl-3-methyl-5-hydroxy-6-metoxy-1,4-benzoquinol methylase